MGRKRGKSKRKKMNPRFFVFCEGKTEESYVKLLRSHFRIPTIDIHPKISGLNITERYINNYKRSQQTHPKDQTYLLYDLDVDTLLNKLQKIPNCILLVSNPAIELWFLLHYKKQTSYINTEECCQQLINRNGKYKKGTIDRKLKEKLISKLISAGMKAKELTEYENPCSTIYRFIDVLVAYKK